MRGDDDDAATPAAHANVAFARIVEASPAANTPGTLVRPDEERIDLRHAAIGKAQAGVLRRVAEHFHYSRAFNRHATRVEQKRPPPTSVRRCLV